MDIRAFTGEIDVAEQAQDLKTLDDFLHLRITTENEYPNHEPVIKWSGAGIAAAGNITAISAQAKAGKTAFTGVLLAGAISDMGLYDGFNSIEVLPNTEGKAVIHFDSEQSEYDQQYHVRTILKRNDIENTPDYLLSYNIRQLTVTDYQPTTDAICEAASHQFGGIHLIVIDGGADYITSVNDEEQAYKIVEYFTHLAIRYDCPVIVVVHLNPNSDKERGHLGSQLQRKCYGLVSIKKDGDTSVAEPKIMRKAGLSDLQPIYYQYNKEKGYHSEVNPPDKEKEKAEKQYNYLLSIASDVFGINSFGHDEAVRAIMKHEKKSESTCKTYLKNMHAWEIINKGDDGRYRKNTNNND